jgi:hypothetical protein
MVRDCQYEAAILPIKVSMEDPRLGPRECVPKYCWYIVD